MSPFWRNFNHCLHWKLSFWQLPVQPVMKISSKWRHFRFSVLAQRWIHPCQVTNLCSKTKWPLYYQTMENSLRNKCVLYSCLYISQSDITLRCLFHQRGCDTHGYMLFSIVELAKDTPHLARMVKLKYTTLSHHGRVMSILNVTKTSSVFSVCIHICIMHIWHYACTHTCIMYVLVKQNREISRVHYMVALHQQILSNLFIARLFFSKIEFGVWAHKRHPIPCSYGQGMGCPLWVYCLICILHLALSSCNDTPWFQEFRTYTLKHPYNTVRYNTYIYI